ncbi:hypothetical protein K474DRAFT_1588842, partial [Panus rudis PR-1116 ss-1]
TLKQYYKIWGLSGTKKQAQTIRTIAPYVIELREMNPTVGYRRMRTLLRRNYQVRVSEKIVAQLLNTIERSAVLARQKGRYVRTKYYAAGVNQVWCFDQHDKFKRFGLFFHIGVDPFPSTGKWLWLIVWWTNSNPRLVTAQYLKVAREIKGVPLLTQSDLGSENFGIANAHTSIRQYIDPSLEGTLQHRWMTGHNNVKPEIAWRQFRREHIAGYEKLFDIGLDNGDYDPANVLQRFIFRWTAIPYLQREVDAMVHLHNRTMPRRDKHKILPHGRPDDIYYYPQERGVAVPPEVFDEAERQWAPKDHPVFDLVPPDFAPFVREVYTRIGEPAIAYKTFWTVYNAMRDEAVRMIQGEPQAGVRLVLSAHANVPDAGEDQGIQLLQHSRAANFGEGDIPELRAIHGGSFSFGLESSRLC